VDSERFDRRFSSQAGWNPLRHHLRVDSAEETVYVNRMKDEIKDAPEFDESRYRDEPYREELSGYYGRSS
jgi:hypothetical protein